MNYNYMKQPKSFHNQIEVGMTPKKCIAPSQQHSLMNYNSKNRNLPNKNEYYYSIQQCSTVELSPPQQQQQVQISDENKYRQLPCKTFVCVGTCPYRDRCVYLHDPRLIHKDAKTKTRKKNSEDSILDSFFWPTMPIHEVRKKLDASRQPHVIQNYLVPGAESWNNKQPDAFIHDSAIYSMWMHFTEFCSTSNNGSYDKNSASFQVTKLYNKYTDRKRLGIFVNLSNSIIPTKSLTGTENLITSNMKFIINTFPAKTEGAGSCCLKEDKNRSMETHSPTTVVDQDLIIKDRHTTNEKYNLGGMVFPEIIQIDKTDYFNFRSSDSNISNSIFSHIYPNAHVPKSKLSDLFTNANSSSVFENQSLIDDLFSDDDFSHHSLEQFYNASSPADSYLKNNHPHPNYHHRDN